MTSTKKYNHAERDEIFEWWIAHDCNYADTAKQFNLSRSTLYRWMERDDWDSRADKIRKDTRAALDKRIVKEEISHLKMAEACLKKEVAAYLQQKSVKGDINAIVKLMQYIDTVKENMPTDGASVTTNFINFDNIPDEQRATVRENIAAYFQRNSRLNGNGNGTGGG